MSFFERWLTMSVLCLSGGIIFLLPFLSEVYYIPMQQALGFTKTQMGMLMSVFGAMALLSYFPGGWIADRLSPRKVMTVALLATSFGGFAFSTLPSFEISLLIFGFWGITTAFGFWAAMIKATRNWAPPEEQGKAFGVLESGRGLSEMASSTILLAIFAWLGSNGFALSVIIQLFAGLNLLLGLLAWYVIGDTSREAQADNSSSSLGLTDIIRVLKLPIVWLLAVIIMTAYCGYWGTFYFTPYATDVFLMSVVLGGAIGVGKMWLKPIAALVAGFFADRIGVSRAVFIFFLVMTSSYLAFGLIPGGPGLIALMIINVAIASTAVFALRGVYFALLEEGGVPAALTGTATGVVSAIGFTPDVFMPLIGGFVLDQNPGPVGYQLFFLTIAGFCAIGSIAAFIVRQRSKRVPTTVPV